MSQADHRDTTKLSRRAALAGLSVAASPLAASAASALQRAGVDPIFAVMAEHREANLALRDACLANDLDMEECPIMARAYERQLAAELPLFTTAPTTVLGGVIPPNGLGSMAITRTTSCRPALRSTPIAAGAQRRVSTQRGSNGTPT
jgi:hypothetical protein